MSEAPIRVVHVITGLELGGAETALVRLLGRLDRAAFDCSVISLIRPGPLGAAVQSLGIPLASLDMRRGLPGPTALPRLVRRLRRARPEVVHAWMYHAGVLATLAAPLAGVPRLAWNIRNSASVVMGNRRIAPVLRACRALSRRPDVIVTNAREARDSHVAAGFDGTRWTVIPNGVDPELFAPNAEARAAVRAELGVCDATPVIGLFARLDPLKGHEHFASAAGLLARERPEVVFLLAGEGTQPGGPIEALRAAAGGADLRLLGARADVPRLMAACDVVTLTSVSEAFPNVLIEAMACGVPCVATDVGDAREIVGEGGTIVPPAAPAALAREWLSLLECSPAERRAMGAAGRARVLRHYALDAVAARYAELYTCLAAR